VLCFNCKFDFNLLTFLCMCRSCIDSRFDATSRQRLVNQVLGNLRRLHYPEMVTLPSGQREITTTWEHFRFAPDGDYGTTQGVVSHDFWVSFFFICGFFFITHVLMHILFCSYVFSCPKHTTTKITHLRSLIAMLTRSSRMQFHMLGFRQTINITRKY
jgi:hypothetical protein